MVIIGAAVIGYDPTSVALNPCLPKRMKQIAGGIIVCNDLNQQTVAVNLVAVSPKRKRN